MLTSKNVTRTQLLKLANRRSRSFKLIRSWKGSLKNWKEKRKLLRRKWQRRTRRFKKWRISNRKLRKPERGYESWKKLMKRSKLVTEA